jgi:hypothetical protein
MQKLATELNRNDEEKSKEVQTLLKELKEKHEES